MSHAPYIIRPIQHWPGTMTAERGSAPFRAPWESTIDLLWHELEMVNAKGIILQLAIGEEDLRRDGDLRAHAKPDHPGVILAFDSTFGPLQYAVDTFDIWRDNVRAIGLALEALRRVERYGVTKHGEQYTGWLALPMGMSVDEAEDLLASYGGERQAILATHPDHGGEAEAFDKVQEARRVIGRTP